MPIRFTCPHCGQLLSVTRKKVGEPVACPNCHGGIIVPQPTVPSLSTTPQGHVSADQPPTTAILEPPTEPARQAKGPQPTNSFVEVTRAALYSIAGLIVAASLLSFLLGFLMGRYSPSATSTREANLPRRLTGRLTYQTQRGIVAADSDAVVILLPVGRQPDEKLDAMSVRPDATRLDAQHPTVLGIRSMGGDITRTRSSGDYALEVPRSGEYFLLFLSGNQQRSADEPPTTIQVAQIARYFTPADMLLGSNAFRWTKEVIQDDHRSDHLFPRP